MVVRTSCIPPTNTIPQCGQIIVHSTNQHSTTWWSDHRPFHQPTHYHMVVRSPCIPPANTVPNGAFHQPTQYHMVVRSWCIPLTNTVPQGGQIMVHFTNQHSAKWWSDHGAFHQPTQYHMVVRSWCIPPTNTVPHGGQIMVHSTNQHSTTRWCIPPTNTVPHGGQIMVHSTNQHSTTWWSDHGAFHQPTQYHTVVRSKLVRKEAGRRAQHGALYVVVSQAMRVVSRAALIVPLFQFG